MLNILTAIITLTNTIVSGISKYIRKRDEKKIRDNPSDSWSTCFGVHVEKKPKSATKTDTRE